MANALASFFKGVERMGKQRAHIWALTNDEDRCKWTANESTKRLQAAYKAVGHCPPLGFSWTSHNLRKGAASAANAIKIAINDIRYAEDGRLTPPSSRPSISTSPWLPPRPLTYSSAT